LAQGQAIFHLSADSTRLDYKMIAVNIDNVVFSSGIRAGGWASPKGSAETMLGVSSPWGRTTAPELRAWSSVLPAGAGRVRSQRRSYVLSRVDAGVLAHQ
jgi:hypothetical protein